MERGNCHFVCYVFQCTDESLVSDRSTGGAVQCGRNATKQSKESKDCFHRTECEQASLFQFKGLSTLGGRLMSPSFLKIKIKCNRTHRQRISTERKSSFAADIFFARVSNSMDANKGNN